MSTNRTNTSKTDLMSPTECLQQLPTLTPEPFEVSEEDGLRRSELRNSLRGITKINHVSEAMLVRSLVEKVLGRLPSATD